MLYLLKFNESSNNDIIEYLNDILVQIIDNGYKVDLITGLENKKLDPKEITIEITKHGEFFNLFDISYELMQCFSYLESESIFLDTASVTSNSRPYILHMDHKQLLDNKLCIKFKTELKRIKLYFQSGHSLRKSYKT